MSNELTKLSKWYDALQERIRQLAGFDKKKVKTKEERDDRARLLREARRKANIAKKKLHHWNTGPERSFSYTKKYIPRAKRKALRVAQRKARKMTRRRA